MTTFSDLILVFINFFKSGLEDLIFLIGLDWLIGSIFLHLIIALVFTIIISLVFNKLILVFIRKWFSKVKVSITEQIVKKKVFRPIGWAIPFLVFEASLGNLSPDGGIVERITFSLIIVVFTFSLTRLLSSLSEVLKGNKAFSGTPIQSYFQLLKLIFYVFGIVIAVCVLTATSPWTILSGLGALTAVLILAFRDTILGLVASIQVFGADTIREGDWVTIPSLDIDGDCMEVGLHTVTVRSFDQALITFPTSKLLEHAFKNWRGLEEAGGRRIKRSLLIDQDSVCFLDKEMDERLKKINLLSTHFKEKEAEISEANSMIISDRVNHRKLTNIGVFRAYILSYLKSNKHINQDLTMMVRQLKPSPNGIPLEIYTFTKSTDWVEYETVQSDIFDHLLAILNLFKLRLIQYPSGHDIRNIGNKIRDDN